jgi:hypothetical protein
VRRAEAHNKKWVGGLRDAPLSCREWAPSSLSMRAAARKGGRRPHHVGSIDANLPGCRWPEIRPPEVPPAQSEDLNLAVPLLILLPPQTSGWRSLIGEAKNISSNEIALFVCCGESGSLSFFFFFLCPSGGGHALASFVSLCNSPSNHPHPACLL